MTYSQNQWLSAFERIIIECEAAPEYVANIPLFKKLLARLKALVAEIKAQAQLQAEDTTVHTNNKNDLLEDATTLALHICGAVHAYADDIKDSSLMKKMDYKVSNFDKIDLKATLIILKLILAELQKLPQTAFDECGIDAEELTELDDLIARLDSSSHDKEIASIGQKGATDQIAALIEEGKSLKKKSLDQLVRQCQRKAPEFFFKYKAASTIRYKNYKKKDGDQTDTDTTK